MSYFVVLFYLVAIVSANTLVGLFGLGANYAMSFLFIAFNLVTRDYLHEEWSGDRFKMGLLIASGSVLTYFVNRDFGQIALASFLAFSMAGVVDYIIYQSQMGRSRFVKSNMSNIVSAFVDSFVFTFVAFGVSQLVEITLIDWSVKVLGGLFWSYVFFKLVGKVKVFLNVG